MCSGFGTAQPREYVVFPRDAFLQFCGQYVLPQEGDCAEMASIIVEWMDAHDLAGVVG